MSGGTALEQVRDRLLARFQGNAAAPPGLQAARAAAAEAFAGHGLPGPRDEAWKYTRLRLRPDESLVPCRSGGDVDALLRGLDLSAATHRVVLVNGVLQPVGAQLPDGVTLTGFAVAPVFGAAARPAREPMVALNTMFAADGFVLSVAPGVDAGIVVIVSAAFGAATEMALLNPRHRIVLGANSRASVLEIAVGEGRYFHNVVTEIDLAHGARLTHARLQQEAAAAASVATIYVDVAAAATYDSFTLNLGAELSRTEIHATLHGAGGATHLNAAQLLGGGQHGDFTTVVNHDAPSCASRQTVKNVLAGRARGVFQGKIEVARAAQHTDGYQMNQALLLSPDAEIDSKPQLEIYADDVKCSHGATVGELDEEQVFYLRSRGIDEATARQILVQAFLADALADVQDESVRDILVAALDRTWETLTV